MIVITREKASIICLCTAAVVSLCVMSAVIISSDKPETMIAVADVQSETSAAKFFTLKNHDGKLALFSSDKSEPIEVYDISVSSFGEYDRMLLRDGIRADTREEINSVIEDYTS